MEPKDVNKVVFMWKRVLVQIFVIGPVREVRKAEAILRGRMIDY